MHRLQEVVRLHRLGKKQRAIAHQLRMGRDTIRESVKAFAAASLLDGPADELPEAALLRAAIQDYGATRTPAQPTSSVDRWRDAMVKLRGGGAKATAIVTSNRALDEWYPLFLDDLIASAAMDRLLHHAHVVVMEGHSYRNPPAGREAGRRRCRLARADLASDPPVDQLGRAETRVFPGGPNAFFPPPENRSSGRHHGRFRRGSVDQLARAGAGPACPALDS
jgi:hypothetical protein